MKQRNGLPVSCFYQYGVVGLVLLASSGYAQEAKPPVAPPNDAMVPAVQDLQQQVRELQDAVEEMRSEASQYRAETAELRRELESSQNQAPAAAVAPPEEQPVLPLRAREAVASSVPRRRLKNEWLRSKTHPNCTNDKMDEQYQTKIESASKYRMRLSGMV